MTVRAIATCCDGRYAIAPTRREQRVLHQPVPGRDDPEAVRTPAAGEAPVRQPFTAVVLPIRSLVIICWKVAGFSSRPVPMATAGGVHVVDVRRLIAPWVMVQDGFQFTRVPRTSGTGRRSRRAISRV